MAFNNNYGKVGVLMGGISLEREISLKSGDAVLNALIEEGVDAIALDIVSEEDDQIKDQIRQSNIDMAFNVLHGRLGEDGRIQGILESLEIAYTGSGVVANSLAINKVKAQNLFKKEGITVPNCVSLIKNQPFDAQTVFNMVGPKCVVKPANEGSSIGIIMADSAEELINGIDRAFEFDRELLIEEFISGREITVGVLDDASLPVVEIRPNSSYFDFEAKYSSGETDYIVPADLDEDVGQKAREVALQAHRLLGCEGISRSDFILDEKNRVFILEINTVPGFTATSLLPKAAKAVGINFRQLCVKILDLAHGKKKEKTRI